MNPQYRVLYPETVREAIGQLLSQAASLGIRPEVAAALRIIDGRLHADPLTYGDVYRDLQRWSQFVRVERPLFVRYAVSHFQREGQYLVFVSVISALSGYGL